MRRAVVWIALPCAIGCARGARPTDVSALIASDGLDGAAAELRFRVSSDPADAFALSALGAIEARRGRPGAALDALEREVALGGPPGAGVPAADRAALAAAYLARAGERVARGAASAQADLDRARSLGAIVPDELARGAAVAAALAEVRHADPRTRARGAAVLAAQPALAGELGDDGAAAAWLWAHGARRAALERFDRWAGQGGLARTTTTAAMASRWIEARAWWDGKIDPARLAQARARGADSCPVAASPGDGCALPDPADPSLDGPAGEPSFWRRAERLGWRGGEPAWTIVAARAWLRGDAPSYEDAVRAHLAPVAGAPMPVWAAPAVAEGPDAADALTAALVDAPEEPPGPRLVVAVEAARAGRPIAEIEAALGPHGALGDALLARIRAAADDAGADAAPPDLAHAAAARALRTTPAASAADRDGLIAIARAYLRDAALGDRIGDDWIAGDVDVAARAPQVAALMSALGDPARARALWQRAALASPGEPAIDRGLALAAAATDDPDAALVLVTGAAAESGDAAPVLVDVARAVAAHGRHAHALELIALALQLVAPDARAPLYDLAIAWSQADGKDAAALIAARAALPPAPSAPPAPPPPTPPPAAPTADPRALAAWARTAADPRVPDDVADDAWAAFAAAHARAAPAP